MIFSGNKEVIIDEIELKNVKVTPYEYEDFKGVSNFKVDSQDFQAFIYQNGSANNVVPRFRIDLIKSFGKDEKRLTSHIVENINYDSGDIKSFNYSLIENDIKKYFENSDEIALQVRVFLDDTNERLITEHLIYNKDKKIFEKAPLGGAGSRGPQDEPINLFEVVQPYQNSYQLTPTHVVNLDNRVVNFNIFFDKSNQYSYDVALYYQGKEIPNKSKHQEIKVRMPVYNYFIGNFIREHMIESDLEETTLSYIEIYYPKALYTVDQTKQEHGVPISD